MSYPLNFHILQAGVFLVENHIYPKKPFEESKRGPVPRWRGVPGFNILEHIYKWEPDRAAEYHSYKLIIKPRYGRAFGTTFCSLKSAILWVSVAASRYFMNVHASQDGWADFIEYGAEEVWRAVQDSTWAVSHYSLLTEHTDCAATREDSGGHATVGLQRRADPQSEQCAEESWAAALGGNAQRNENIVPFFPL